MRPCTIKFSNWNKKLKKRQYFQIECVLNNIQILGVKVAQDTVCCLLENFRICMNEKYMDDFLNDKSFTELELIPDKYMFYGDEKDGNKKDDLIFRLKTSFDEDKNDVYYIGYDRCSNYDYHYVNDYENHANFSDDTIIFFNNAKFLAGWNLFNSIIEELKLSYQRISYIVKDYIVSVRKPVNVFPHYTVGQTTSDTEGSDSD